MIAIGPVDILVSNKSLFFWHLKIRSHIYVKRLNQAIPVQAWKGP